MTIKQVQEFHEKFDLPLGDEDKLNDAAYDFRLRFMQEELAEFAQAYEADDKVGQFDALLDLAYVVFGTALFMGISPEQWDQGMNEVQRCNMTKLRVKNVEDSTRKSKYDVVKPKDWTGPETKLKEIIDGEV